ncbi:MAG: outer membrane lipoprotein-sorting protein [Spirochaeta sp.]|jgi:outer membrane lipoprotein-sorting protein|nr:outer membrane lipoprotein-sorting protein [Spirochaeta sp.]
MNQKIWKIELRSAMLLLAVLYSITPLAGAQSASASAEALIQQAQSYTADELMNLADDALFPESFFATMRMTTVRPGRRDTEMLFENYHREGAGSFMEVKEPRRSAGMRFLQKNDDLWMYNPRSSSRRALRLSPRDSFQGSVFSNNDVSDPNYADDYTAVFDGTEVVTHPETGRVTTVKITATASHDESAYGTIEMWLMPEGSAGAGSAAGNLRVIPLQIDYYSRSGLLFKRMTLLEIGELAGARRPAVMRMESLEEAGAVTTVRLETLEARDDIPERLFNQQELTR